MIKELEKNFSAQCLKDKSFISAAEAIFLNERNQFIVKFGNLESQKLKLFLSTLIKDLERALGQDKYIHLNNILISLLVGAATNYSTKQPVSTFILFELLSIFEEIGIEHRTDKESAWVKFAISLDGFDFKENPKDFFKSQEWLKIISKGKKDGTSCSKFYFNGLEEAWTKLLKDLVELFTTLAGEPAKEKVIQETNLITYNWLGKIEKDLPELFENLIGKWISSENTLEQLIIVFSAQPIKKIKPIIWHNDNASEVLYFLLQLEEAGLIESKLRTDYKKLKACFYNNDKKPFNQSFKDLKNKLEFNLSLEKRKAIDKLISNFQ